jgi:hypothetical protein
VSGLKPDRLLAVYRTLGFVAKNRPGKAEFLPKLREYWTYSTILAEISAKSGGFAADQP